MSEKDALPVVAYWIQKAEQFCLPADDGSPPFVKAWKPLADHTAALEALSVLQKQLEEAQAIISLLRDEAAARTSDACDIAVQLDQYRADAERYRKWRTEYAKADSGQEISDMMIHLADCWTEAEVDAAIDAARTSLSEKQHG